MPVRKMINHIPPSPVKVNLEEESLMKQGIVTILRSDYQGSKTAGSIRRTLSADMSSKKWLDQNGFLSPIKKTISSEALVPDSSSETDYELQDIPNQDEVWRSIQAQKQLQKPSENNQVWGSILTQKSENTTLPPPYVHPLVKRSASSLTIKSLEVCTEIFGSESGSDCFSSSEILSNADSDEQEKHSQMKTEEFKDSTPFPDLHVAKYRKSPPRPFPPPIPSISGGDGVSLHMQPHRENGRLVLEAVSVPPRNYFHAKRQDGRLLLTLIHPPPPIPATEDEEILPEKVVVVVVEEKSTLLSPHSGMMKVDKSGIVMKKLAENINPTWSKKIDEQVPIPLPPLVPRFVPPPTAASFNMYDYFWRNKTAAGFLNPMITNKMNGYENQDLRANKTETYLKGCKEARRSLAIPAKPSCWIATS